MTSIQNRNSMTHKVAELERRIATLERTNSALAQPLIGYSWSNMMEGMVISQTTTSWKNTYGVWFPEQVPTGQLWVSVQVDTSFGAVPCEIRLRWQSSGIASSAIVVPSPTVGLYEFRWRHTQITGDRLVLQARHTATTPTTEMLVFPPADVRIAIVVPGATTTGVPA